MKKNYLTLAAAFLIATTSACESKKLEIQHREPQRDTSQAKIATVPSCNIYFTEFGYSKDYFSIRKTKIKKGDTLEGLASEGAGFFGGGKCIEDLNAIHGIHLKPKKLKIGQEVYILCQVETVRHTDAPELWLGECGSLSNRTENYIN